MIKYIYILNNNINIKYNLFRLLYDISIIRKFQNLINDIYIYTYIFTIS